MKKADNKRQGYEKLAAALAAVAEAANNSVEPIDVRNFDNESPVSLFGSIQDHLQILFDRLEWTDPRTFEKFYVEMRLWGDQMEAERKEN